MAKIVFITSRFPFPPEKGDQLRVYQQLVHLSNYHEIHLISISEKKVKKEDFNALNKFCSSNTVFAIPIYKRIIRLIIAVFSCKPFQVAYFFNPTSNKNIRKLICEIQPEFVHANLIRTSEYVRDINFCIKTLDFMDAFSEGLTKRISYEKNVFKRMIFKEEKRRVLKYESIMLNNFDRVCIISEQDRSYIQNVSNKKINVIPNGVDFHQFYPKCVDKIFDLVFMGNLDYLPNIVALNFLIDEVFPETKKRFPNITLLIAGRNATKEIHAKVSKSIVLKENFTDISEALASARIHIAPMKISIGLQNKIIQSMAMKLPNIVSQQANNAIKAINGQELLVANSVSEYVDSIALLLENKVTYETISNNAYSFVHKNFDWKTITSSMNIQLFSDEK